MGIKSISLATIALVLSTSANAALIERLGGLAYYDDVNNLTWLADANYAMTSGYDADGEMTWGAAVTWADTLDFSGYDDWRLPTTPGTSTGFHNEGELAHLFYDEGVSSSASTLFTNVKTYDGLDWYGARTACVQGRIQRVDL